MYEYNKKEANMVSDPTNIGNGKLFFMKEFLVLPVASDTATNSVSLPVSLISVYVLNNSTVKSVGLHASENVNIQTVANMTQESFI